MRAAEARETVLDQTFEISQAQFEVLCKVVLADQLRTRELTDGRHLPPDRPADGRIGEPSRFQSFR